MAASSQHAPTRHHTSHDAHSTRVATVCVVVEAYIASSATALEDSMGCRQQKATQILATSSNGVTKFVKVC
jgi:hypothetical protein